MTNQILNDANLVVISADYPLGSLPPFIKEKIQEEKYNSLGINEYISISIGKATVLLIKK
jgi:hypothetical protein